MLKGNIYSQVMYVTSISSGFFYSLFDYSESAESDRYITNLSCSECKSDSEDGFESGTRVNKQILNLEQIQLNLTSWLRFDCRQYIFFRILKFVDAIHL